MVLWEDLFIFKMQSTETQVSLSGPLFMYDVHGDEDNTAK